ncbi:hypothetical protein JTE90_022534 [Oedothorax gibbosus]|uniref:PDZ domain-containing protein n=1 Tax=Oedothorax gibbosus TaxID=931172 RepID=A0AAV6TYX4_9ARAC|nr:hypothetical protein JTE90_022534 [Oedothorax gibbosus]
MPGNRSEETDNLMSTRPPPISARSVSVSLQSWPTGDNGYGNSHARSASMDSLESSGSSGSSSAGQSRSHVADTGTDYIATRTVGKTPKLPAHNPLQFVKVQSPLYIKAEKQIQLTKEVKITREALKEGEEEWQSNLDNWKSRRRKVSEKVIQRAEEMRQIEAEEQLRQEQHQQQQRKIKKFSEMRSSSRSYNLDLYIGQGDDSGLGGTPEPDDTLDKMLRSDTSEGMTSEAESIDSDINKSEKISEKEPPKVPQKPQSRLSRDAPIDELDIVQTSSIIDYTHQLETKNLSAFDNFSSTDPSDVEGHCGDNETVSSEEDMPYLTTEHKSTPLIKKLYEQTENNSISCEIDSIDSVISQEIEDSLDMQTKNENAFKLSIKPGDNRGFGFSLKGGKDQRCSPYIDTITKYSAADMAGIKEGYQIIFLNGEKAAESSHASLIFSVKQAVYTGVLDIIVSPSLGKSPVSTDLQNKTSNRKSAFAEKLALFSSGVNGANPNSEENKCMIISSKNGCSKPESLVLRRRSAFENGKNENYITNRRSSCLTQDHGNTNIENVKKRLSVDFSQFNIQENGPIKKGPPPPVPTKPKLRPKTSQDFSNDELEKINCINKCQEYSDSDNPNSIKDKCLLAENQNIFSSKVPDNENKIETSMTKLNLEDETVEIIQNGIYNTNKAEISSSNNQSLYNNFIQIEHEYLNYDITNMPNDATSNISKSVEKIDTVIDSVGESNSDDFKFSESTLSFSTIEIPPIAESDPIDCQKEEILCEGISDISKKPVPESVFTVSFTSNKPTVFDENEISFDTSPLSSESETENFSIDDTNPDIHPNSDDTQISTLEEQRCSEQNPVPFDVPNGNELNSSNEESENLCNIESSNDFSEQTNLISDCSEETNLISDSSEETNLISDSSELTSHIQINFSPLCLPLEKIDEDDVISASTTTSSETPDTETVIETIPLNLSPLPNDESNGEEPNKISDSQDMSTKQVAATESSTDFEMHGQSISDCSEALAKVPKMVTDTPNVSKTSNNNTFMFIENEDEEYRRELDESLDQITSLDVIDEMEQQLMYQLEQQGDTYEEIDDKLTAQLEDDMNKQWLYYTEEADLLDDLTPRSVQPPSEPPPPPPPADLEDSEPPLMPMPRLNSTKRIKKEIWRRRSDFLGLDSPSVLDVDNLLPPPPPGMEEILKQEREQNQWLEKRLSLAESEVTSPLYMSEPSAVEPQYNQGEYSHYFLEEDLSVTTVSQSEKWTENIDEDGSFDPTCDMQYVPVADVPSPASEGISKIEESPLRKAKQNIHNLGAAPKAKIVDSTKWITEQVIQVSKKSVEPVFHQSTYNQNYWLAQDDERKKIAQCAPNAVDRRLSMPQFTSHHPDVTIRTWGDREYEFQKQRPRSAVWNSTDNGDAYDPYSYNRKQDILRSHSLDSHRDNCDVDTLESEVHNCSSCGKGLCEGSAMGIEALRLYFHIECFRCIALRLIKLIKRINTVLSFLVHV